MASIAEWIEKIKTAIYGEEVRGAIWQSLEAMNTEVEAINVDEEQIQTNKTNIATNTAAIAALNSRFANNAGSHNGIYRGKNLGTTVTSAQWAAIKAGTFDDLYIGDYWVINSVNWRIAAFDYWLNCGDTNTTAHHVVIVPDTVLHSARMNSTNITTGAYLGSDFYTGNNDNTGRSNAITKVNSAFGSAHILSHRVPLTNTVTNGYISGYAWTDSTVDLMSEKMVYGTQIYSAMPNGTTIPSQYTVDKSQLPLFALEPSRISNRANWWLRSVVSSTNFALANDAGGASNAGASASIGVRPAFAIYQS